MRFSTFIFMITVTLLVAAGVVIPHANGNAVQPASLSDVASNNTLFDVVWNKFANKGGALICGLEGTDRTAGRLINDPRNPPSAASIFNGDPRQDMRDWYWHDSNPSGHGCDFDTFWHFGAVMRALGLNARSKSAGGDNMCYKTEHWDRSRTGTDGRQLPPVLQWYDNGGKQFKATGSEHEFAMNTVGGAIIGLYLDSPKSAASRNWYGNKKDPEIAQLPHLHALSDILWAFWNRDNSNVKNIKYFFMLGISNEETNQIVASCLHKAGKTLSEWPGASFMTNTEEGHALLGSPNGGVFAYFLLQHKAELGHKTITKITIIRPESEEDTDFVDPALVFHVADAADPPPDTAQMQKNKRRDGHTVGVVQQGKKNIVRTHKFQM
ncbi:hypothetical protein CC86DRAFT_439187 [Ophiobolus disseminans]|uniref:Uncharacterized protein n=1 Tax=Ophiobolus disseminans TaxID=1469910 RepID=A0A6A7A4J7_9PLEO|nr:hypothetical protein CC86DRAFT_439187 [Ophiobolus disseminans]